MMDEGSKQGKYSLEVTHQIWDDRSGERLEVRPDRDGLGLTEIAYVDPSGKCCSGVLVDDEQLPLLIKALSAVLYSKESR